jgi:transposase InsO family protein
MIDHVGMWPELVATEDSVAETVVQALFDNIISRYGMPKGISILSDNGSAFISKLTAEFCKAFSVEHVYFSLSSADNFASRRIR